MKIKILLILAISALSSISKATIWVGGDAACDYTSIQPALDELVSGTDDQLYIANNNSGNGVYTENLNIINNRPDQIRIRGGYDACEGSPTESPTEINGGGLAPVMNISGDDTPSNIDLRNLRLTDGTYDNNFWAGGLNIDDKHLQISLNDMSITNNQGYYGGGIYSKGGEGDGIGLRMRLYRTLVTNNIAEYGGGMYCLGKQVNTIWDKSGVSYNSAISGSQFAGHGGGLFIENGCTVFMSSGNNETISLEGVVGNSATGDGGGAYVIDGSQLILIQIFGNGKYVVFSDNTADSDNNSSGKGGAIYLSGNTSKLSGNRQDIIIKNNTAVDGGAVAAVNNASVNFNSDSRCTQKNPCFEFIGNSAGQNTNGTGEGRGGTFYVDEASVFVQRAKITESQADSGVIAYVNNGELDLDFNLIHDNGSSPNSEFNQDHLLVSFNSQVELKHVTLADNQQDPTTTLLLGINSTILNIKNSILQGIGYATFEGFTNTGTSLDLTFKCNVMHEDSSIGSNGDISDNTITSNPGFMNSSNRDYRLTAGSTAIDKCNGVNTTTQTQIDYTGQVTGVDDPYTINALGVYDAGAHENYQWDVIFEDKFE